MARRKPARVDWIVHDATGIKIALRLDKTSMVFEAEYNDETYTSSVGTEVCDKILSLIEADNALEFTPVIRLEIENIKGAHSHSQIGGIRVSCNRFYITTPVGTGVYPRKIGWDHMSEGKPQPNRLGAFRGFHVSDLPLPVYKVKERPRSYGTDSTVAYLPYSEGMWNRAQDLASVMERLAAYLRKVMNSELTSTPMYYIGYVTHQLNKLMAEARPPEAEKDE